MKNLNVFPLIAFATITFTLGSCGVANKKNLAAYDDMYYSPSEARKYARMEERNRKLTGGTEDMSPSFQGTSSYTEEGNSGGNTIINNYYGSDYRMDYGGYFNRFGGGYRPASYMRPMMYGTGMSFWMRYNNFGMGYGMGMGYPMMGMGGFYDPYWGGMGMGMMGGYGYNPYMMNPYMNGFGMGYNAGFMNGYMYGAGGYGTGGSIGGSSLSRPQPVMVRRASYGTNQSAINRNRNSASYRTTNAPNSQPNSIQSRGTSRSGSAQTPASRGQVTPPASRQPSSGTTTRRSTTTPSRTYNQPAPSRSNPSFNTPSAPRSSGSSGGSRGGSGSSGGGRGGRR